jgi:hypothetical protein
VSLPELPFLAEWHVASPFLTYPPFASLNLAPAMGPFFIYVPEKSFETVVFHSDLRSDTLAACHDQD